MQADAYAGFHHLYDTGRIVEAACWAHVRRKFFDLHEAQGSPIAKEALDRIGALYGTHYGPLRIAATLRYARGCGE